MSYPFLSQFSNPVKNIIFDLGGVLLDIDYQASVQAFVELGFTDFSSTFSQAKQTTLFDAFETGSISAAEFRAELRKLAPYEITDIQIDNAWNAMLGSYRLSSLSKVLELGKNYRVFLLSNTNEIHYPYIDSLPPQGSGHASLSEFFEKDYYSHLIHACKPNADAFQRVLQENNLLAGETLFIDDTSRHIEGAKKVGLNVFQLTPPATIAALFS
ncbi:MAG: HAD family phosphatase [Prevotellaceae bacterium]|nr:HAD family phosphatase [Prevotellaceae bacterium]